MSILITGCSGMMIINIIAYWIQVYDGED